MVAGTLCDVLPAAATAMGVDLSPWAAVPAGADGGAGEVPGAGLALPAARHVVVVLVDGLGDVLLRGALAHTPYLRSVLADGSQQARVMRLRAGFPSTTATSMASFGTGRPPGAHGMVGFESLDPGTGLPVNHLRWENGPDPHVWQDQPTVFELAHARGARVVRIGPGHFDGSGLTEAALRGGAFAAAAGLDQRVDAAVRAVRETPAGGPGALVYVYWGDVDKVGHQAGCGSDAWLAQVEAVDAGLRRLVRGLRKDTLVLVTADHGMVDVPLDQRVDLAHEPDLDAGVRLALGDPRALQLHVEDGAVDDVTAAWRERLAGRMRILTRAEAVAEGLFGAVREVHLPRLGDVVAIATGTVAVVDSRRTRPEFLSMVGQHGALSDAEQLVPLIAVPGGLA